MLESEYKLIVQGEKIMNKRKAYIISVLLFCFFFMLVGCKKNEESVVSSSAEESFSSVSEQSSEVNETGSIDDSLQDISSAAEQPVISDEADFTRDFLEELYSCSKKRADEISEIRTAQGSGKLPEYFKSIFGSRLAYSFFEAEIMSCYMTRAYSIAMTNSTDIKAKISFPNYSDSKPYNYIAELFASDRKVGSFMGIIDAELIDEEWKVSFLDLH